MRREDGGAGCDNAMKERRRRTEVGGRRTRIYCSYRHLWHHVLLITALSGAAVFVHPASISRTPHDGFIRRPDHPGGLDHKAGFKLVASGQRRDSTIDYPCPYAIDTEEEALARQQDTSIPGNVLTVEHLRFCRTGNHFSSAFRNLALGYCCKSKLVVLPPKDDVLAPGIFSEGNPGPRWFDFSSAPDVEGFNSSTCATDITWAGPRAFRMQELETPGHPHEVPMLKACIAKVPRLLGCEAAYYFPKDLDLCHMPEKGEGERSDESTGVELHQEEAEETPDGGQKQDGTREKSAGNLVIHIRSGDIFDNDVLNDYGQPPLQFYAHVMHSMPWDRVDIVTYADHPRNLSPVVQALLWVQSRGKLGDNVHIHTNRTMGEDLRTMMCADGLAVARSTLVDLVGFHTNARWVYAASSCRSRLQGIVTARPNTMVYGIRWPRDYSVYQNWQNTPQQRAEMVSYKTITGFTKCLRGDP